MDEQDFTVEIGVIQLLYTVNKPFSAAFNKHMDVNIIAVEVINTS